MTLPDPPTPADQTVDGRYYEVAGPGSLAERLVIAARDGIYNDFLRLTRPTPESTLLDVGVSDVVGDAANVLERKYPALHRVTAVGLGAALQLRAAYPELAYRQIEPGAPLPFADASFDIATSNAVLEHVGGPAQQAAFVAELVRVARTVFVSVPHRFFPVEHHTGIPLLHWTDRSFAVACRALGKAKWAEPANLILMTRTRLRRIGREAAAGCRVQVGSTGIPLGPCSSNLFLLIGAAG